MIGTIIGAIPPPREPSVSPSIRSGSLGAELDLIHLQTVAGIGFGHQSYQLPVKEKYNICVSFKHSVSAMSVDLVMCFVCESRGTQHHE